MTILLFLAGLVGLIGGAELLERESDLQMASEQREELRRVVGGHRVRMKTKYFCHLVPM